MSTFDGTMVELQCRQLFVVQMFSVKRHNFQWQQLRCECFRCTVDVLLTVLLQKESSTFEDIILFLLILILFTYMVYTKTQKKSHCSASHNRFFCILCLRLKHFSNIQYTIQQLYQSLFAIVIYAQYLTLIIGKLHF